MKRVSYRVWGLLGGIVLVGGAVLYFLLVSPSQESQEPVPRSVTPAAGIPEPSSWAWFRGDSSLTGIAKGTLPDRLKLDWKFETGGPITSSPVVDGARVYIGSEEGAVYAVKLASGKQVWRFETGDAVEAPPCVIEGIVYVGSNDGFLYALDAATGELRWKYETDGKIMGAANGVRISGDAKLRVLVGSYDNALHCVDGTTGERLWVYETGNYVNGSVALLDDMAVVGGCDGYLHLVSLLDGHPIGTIDTGAYIAGSVACRDRKAFVGNYEGIFLAADLDTHAILWRDPTIEDPILTSPAVDGSRVLFGARDGKLHCLREDTGNVIWEFQARDDVDSSPVICGDKVVFGSDDGRLYLVRIEDGKQVWSYEIGEAISSSPAVVGSRVIVGCEDGVLYAFRGR